MVHRKRWPSNGTTSKKGREAAYGTSSSYSGTRLDATEALGSFGRWHAILMVYCIILGFILAFHDTIGLDFLAPSDLSFTCQHTFNESLPYSERSSSLQNFSDVFSSTKIGDTKSQCDTFAVRLVNESSSTVGHRLTTTPTTTMTTDVVDNDDNIKIVVDLNRTVPCSHWTFDHDLYRHTYIEEWHLVCSSKWMRVFPYMAHYLGLFVGLLLFGVFSDCVGRMPSICLGTLVHVGAAIGAAFTPSLKYFALTKALSSLGLAGMLMAFVLQLETYVPRHRCFVVIGLVFSWSLGLIAFPAAALWLSPTWRHLQLAAGIASAVVLPFAVFLRESPRWLLSTGRYERAECNMLAIARLNKSMLTEMDVIHIRQTYLDQDTYIQRSYSLFSPHVRLHTLCVWTVMLMAGFVLNFGSSPTDDLIDPIPMHPSDAHEGRLLKVLWPYIMWAAIQGAAALFALHALRFWPRKWSAFLCYFLLAGAYGFTIVLPKLEHATLWANAVVVLTSRFLAASGVSIIFIHFDEVFPTVLRATGSATKILFFKLGILIEPIARHFLNWSPRELPAILYGTLCALIALILIVPPDTRKKPLPDTIDDLQALSGRLPHHRLVGTGGRGRKCKKRASDTRKPCLEEKGTVTTSFTYDNMEFHTKF